MWSALRECRRSCESAITGHWLDDKDMTGHWLDDKDTTGHWLDKDMTGRGLCDKDMISTIIVRTFLLIFTTRFWVSEIHFLGGGKDSHGVM